MSNSKSDQSRALLADWQASRPEDYLQHDPNMQRVLRMHMGEAFDRHQPLLENVARLSATRMDLLAIESNRDENLPRLNRYSAIGERIEEVVFHPSYHELGAIIWDTGVLAVLKDPGNDLLCGAIDYFIAHNGEAGHTCPVACTAGLIKLLQQVGSAEQQQRYLPRLLDKDYSRRLHAAQFVTEIQGGSDVGENDCIAVPDNDRQGMYRISGEKWFCSVIDAGAFVVTARPQGAVHGTKGLGVFLVPRTVDGEVNRISIRRLKYKLGTRSMASAEIDLDGALAEPIGPLEDGFKNLVGIVLDTSRLHNAVCNCGLMRRACIEAQSFAGHRHAFGRAILQHPMVAEIVARMLVVTTAAIATTFRILAVSDDISSGDVSSEAHIAFRTQLNINKYWVSIRCSEVVHDAIEVLGGNGAIEEFSVLPRLYRDAIVLESWEGTHNTLCAQVLRDFSVRAHQHAWLAEMRRLLETISHPSLATHQSRAGDLLDEVTRRIEQLLSSEAEVASLHIRSVVDRMCVLNSYLSLLRERDWELGQEIESGKGALVDLYRCWYVDDADPMDTTDLLELIQSVVSR
jgi:alkylation response protein AidB-like acyl-CoA dehydrogenase